MKKPLSQPSLQPMRDYVRPLVLQALRAAGYKFSDEYIQIYSDTPTFAGWWTCSVFVFGQVMADGIGYDLEGVGEVDKVVGKPKWRDARIDIRLHPAPCELDHQLDIVHLRVRDSN